MSPKIPTTDPIKYLVYRNFPEMLPLAREENGLSDTIEFDHQLIDTSPTLETHEWPHLSPEAEKYRQELASLDKNKLELLYREEVDKQHEEEDKNRFFNQHDSDADFDYWAKMPEWTIDEAVVLAFGKEPRVVTWTRLEKILSYTSPFVKKCIEFKELIQRARKANLLTEPRLAFSNDLITPYKFVTWAKANRIDLPNKLADFVLQAYEANKPPKTALEKSLEQLSRPIDQTKGPLTQRTEEVIRRKNNKANTQKPPVFLTKEKETLLKMVIGMAIDGYGYDPSASRSPIPAQISEILVEQGMALDVDTVRKWLKQGADLVPQQIIKEKARN